MNEIVALAGARFTIITTILGDAQGRVLAMLFYFTILAPFGLLARLFSDPLRVRARHQQPTWLAREPVDHGLEGAKRQG